MQIHVVQSGQSLYGIGQAFGVSADEIIRVNELDPSRPLVVGEALVIPIVGSYYWVQPGDSLYRIGQRLGISPQEIARVNQISLSTPLQVGFRLYIPPRPRRPIEVNAYVEPLGGRVTESLEQAAREAAPDLTYLAPFSYQARRDGSLVAPPLNDFPNIAQANGATLMMVVTNLEEGQFSDELGRIILNDEQVRDRLLDNVLRIAREQGFRDIHFDFEFLRPTDRDAYVRFLQLAAQRIHQDGRLISAALAPKTSATQRGLWYEAHDYPRIAAAVDFVVPMTYEWGYSGGPPMAVSPIGPVRQVIEYALTEMPANKILMGQNLYGYDWTLPYRPGGEFARVVSPKQAVELAAREGARIQYDYQAQAPNFQYVDDQGRTHQVWFEDARSIQAKFNLIRELGLRGISYWKLGLNFPQNWVLLRDNFTITKRRTSE